MAAPVMVDHRPPVEAGLCADDAGAGAFEDFYGEFAPRLRGLVRRLIPDPDLVDDIVQETLLRAYSTGLHLETGTEQWPWLATVARNGSLDLIRRRQRNGESPLDLRDPPVSTTRGNPEDEVLRAVRRASVSRALAAVPSRQRRILVLKHVDGWRYEELAAAEGVSFDALKSALARARRNFKKQYEALTQQASAVERSVA